MSGPLRDVDDRVEVPLPAQPLFGRDRELLLLREAITHAAAGRPGIVVVAGETGVGKSSLLAAALRQSAATVLFGACVPLLGQDMPFAPIVQALRGLRRGQSGLPAELDRLLTGGPAEPDADRPATAGDGLARELGAPLSGAGQVRLFEAVLRLLADLGDRRPDAPEPARPPPVALLVEDVHWADRSTLDLLGFLARNLTAERLLVALSVRTDGVARGDPVAGWLAELDRLPGCATVRLDRLDRQATAGQVAALLGRPPDDALVRLVHEHAAGNPLFTEQLLPWTSDPSRPLPTTLRDLVGARFAALPEGTRRVLEVASVLGRDVGLRLLAAVVGHPEEDVEEALREAVRQQLVDPGPGAGYAFRHPLFREVLASELLPGDRRRLHARAARALTDDPDAGPGPAFPRLAEVARHWEDAAEPDLAFRTAVVAGLAAMDVAAYREADELLGRAVRLSERAGVRRPDDLGFADVPVDGVGLLAQASQAAHLVGDDDRAITMAERAAADCADPLRRAQVLERLGAYCFDAGRAERADSAYRQALDLLPAAPPTPARARVYAGLAMLATGWSRLDEARAWCAQAIALAHAVGARAAEGEALNAMGVVTAFDGDVEGGVAYLRQAVGIAEALSDPDDLALASINLSHVLGVFGRYGEAVDVCRSGLEVLRRVGGVGPKAGFLRANAADALLHLGRWDEAEGLAVGSADGPHGVLDFPLVQVRARLAIGRGDLPEAQRWVAALQDILDAHELPDAWRREFCETAAELALWAGRPQDAAELTEATLRAVRQGDERRFAAGLVWLRARALADLAERAAARRDDERLARARRSGRELAAESVAEPATPSGPAGRPSGPIRPEDVALAATARAELRRLDGVDATGEWGEAVARWQVLGPGLPCAYARWREAEARVAARGSFEATVRAVRAAMAAATALRARLLADEVRQLARVARVEVVTQADEPEQAHETERAQQVARVQQAARPSAGSAPRVPAPRSGDGSADLDVLLTPREREVLAGLVAGRTNGEIARALFISVKTASVHVSNILRKLEVPNREQAARLGYRMGLGSADGGQGGTDH